VVPGDLLLLPIAAGMVTAGLLPFTGYKWDGDFIRPVGIAAFIFALAVLAISFVASDNPQIGPGSARWAGNLGAIAILLANGVSIIITRRALRRKRLGQPYRF
jgi:membrane protein DedA with SNARE-associated domain